MPRPLAAIGGAADGVWRPARHGGRAHSDAFVQRACDGIDRRGGVFERAHRVRRGPLPFAAGERQNEHGAAFGRRLVEVDHHGVPIAADVMADRLRQRDPHATPRAPSDSAASIDTAAIGCFASASDASWPTSAPRR